MLEYFQMRLAPLLILSIALSLLMSNVLSNKLDKNNFERKYLYNAVIYSPFIISGLFIAAVALTL